MTGRARGRPGAGKAASPMPVDEVQAGTLKYPGGHVESGEKVTDSDFKTQIGQGEPDSATALATSIQAFQLSLERTGRSRSTVVSYVQAVKRAAHAVGTDPATWGPEECEALRKTPQWASYMPRTRAMERQALKAFWTHMGCEVPLGPKNRLFWLDRKGYSGSSRREELKAKAPSPAEVAKVLAVTSDTCRNSKNPDEVWRAFGLFLVAAYGLRRICVINLRPCDFHFDQNYIHVPKSKGGKSRDVFMDVPCKAEYEGFMSARASIVASLLSRSEAAEGHFLTKIDLTRADTYLFFDRGLGGLKYAGKQTSAESMGSMLSYLAQDLLGRNANPHGFRHAKIFQLLEEKRLPISDVARYVGHGSIQMTMEYSFAGVESFKESFERSNGGPLVQAPAAAPPAPAPLPAIAPNVVESKVKALCEAFKAGLLTTEAFTAAVNGIKS